MRRMAIILACLLCCGLAAGEDPAPEPAVVPMALLRDIVGMCVEDELLLRITIRKSTHNTSQDPLELWYTDGERKLPATLVAGCLAIPDVILADAALHSLVTNQPKGSMHLGVDFGFRSKEVDKDKVKTFRQLMAPVRQRMALGKKVIAKIMEKHHLPGGEPFSCVRVNGVPAAGHVELVMPDGSSIRLLPGPHGEVKLFDAEYLFQENPRIVWPDGVTVEVR